MRDFGVACGAGGTEGGRGGDDREREELTAEKRRNPREIAIPNLKLNGRNIQWQENWEPPQHSSNLPATNFSCQYLVQTFSEAAGVSFRDTVCSGITYAG